MMKTKGVIFHKKKKDKEKEKKLSEDNVINVLKERIKKELIEEQKLESDRNIQSSNNQSGDHEQKKEDKSPIKKMFDEKKNEKPNASDAVPIVEKSEASPEEQGQSEAIKEDVKEEVKTNKRLEDLVNKTDQVLLQISNVFPFDLFRDKIIIDMTKVNIITGYFFSGSRVHSVYIEDISDVFVETAPIFAALKIIDSGFVENEIMVRYLRKEDAFRARRIIQGLIVAKKNNIDLAKLDIKNLTKKLEDLGSIKETN